MATSRLEKAVPNARARVSPGAIILLLFFFYQLVIFVTYILFVIVYFHLHLIQANKIFFPLKKSQKLENFLRSTDSINLAARRPPTFMDPNII